MRIPRLALAAATFVVPIITLHTASIAEENGTWTETVFAKSGTPTDAASASDTRRTAKPVRARAITARVAKPKEADDEPTPSTRGTSLAGSAITWQASSGCAPGQLRGVLADVVSNFGPITVTSTCRSPVANRAAGGAGQSYHLSGEAIDFRVHGNVGAVYAYLSTNNGVGGLKHYGGGLFHIDTGPRRSF
jgi:hypothetical protein